MYKYKYEMHAHTSPLLGGAGDIRDFIDALIEKGFSGMVVTNHFFLGDTKIDRELPWEEFVDYYRRDYLLGLEHAKERDFDLLFGIEEGVGTSENKIRHGKEILIYGISPDFLAEHPELKGANAEKYAEVIHAAGGLLFQAHPYRERWYIPSPGPIDALDLLDGIEVCNASNKPEWNEMAQSLANERALKCVAGSDAHTAKGTGRAGIAAKERLRTNEDLIRVLKSGDYKIIENKD
jgi:predicted metal-dependent phosphoesterase TrpH